MLDWWWDRFSWWSAGNLCSMQLRLFPLDRHTVSDNGQLDAASAGGSPSCITSFSYSKVVADRKELAMWWVSTCDARLHQVLPSHAATTSLPGDICSWHGRRHRNSVPRGDCESCPQQRGVGAEPSQVPKREDNGKSLNLMCSHGSVR